MTSVSELGLTEQDRQSLIRQIVDAYIPPGTEPVISVAWAGQQEDLLSQMPTLLYVETIEPPLRWGIVVSRGIDVPDGHEDFDEVARIFFPEDGILALYNAPMIDRGIKGIRGPISLLDRLRALMARDGGRPPCGAVKFETWSTVRHELAPQYYDAVATLDHWGLDFHLMPDRYCLRRSYDAVSHIVMRKRPETLVGAFEEATRFLGAVDESPDPVTRLLGEALRRDLRAAIDHRVKREIGTILDRFLERMEAVASERGLQHLKRLTMTQIKKVRHIFEHHGPPDPFDAIERYIAETSLTVTPAQRPPRPEVAPSSAEPLGDDDRAPRPAQALIGCGGCGESVASISKPAM